MEFRKADDRVMECNVGELMHILKRNFLNEGKGGVRKAMEMAFGTMREMAIDLEKRRQEGAQYRNENETDEGDAYTLKKGPGCVLMMSNSFKGSGKMSREKASAGDLRMMSTLWKSMGNCELFNVEDDGQQPPKKAFVERQFGNECVYENLNGDKMEELLKSLSETQKDYSYIVVYISTHGCRMPETRVKDYNDGKIEGSEKSALDYFKECEEKGINRESSVQIFLGNDKKPVREDRILELFHNHKNKKLDGIPKFFILDYCRSVPKSGKEPESKVNTESLGNILTEEDKTSPRASLPVMSDMLLLNATHDFFLAFDEHNEDGSGSKLTKSLYDVFMDNENYKQKEAVDMLTMVNARMKPKCSEKQAMSAFQSSLDKKFYLFDQSSPPPNHADRKRRVTQK